MSTKIDKDVTRLNRRVGKTVCVGFDKKGNWFSSVITERFQKAWAEIPDEQKYLYDKAGCIGYEKSILAQEIFDRGLKATKDLQLA